jgi:hypothetical protein
VRRRTRQPAREHRHELADARGHRLAHPAVLAIPRAHDRTARAHALAHGHDERERLRARLLARFFRAENRLGHERGQRAECTSRQPRDRAAKHTEPLALRRAENALTGRLEALKQRRDVELDVRALKHARAELVRALLQPAIRVGERAAIEQRVEQPARVCHRQTWEQQQQQVERRACDTWVLPLQVGAE